MISKYKVPIGILILQVNCEPQIPNAGLVPGDCKSSLILLSCLVSMRPAMMYIMAFRAQLKFTNITWPIGGWRNITGLDCRIVYHQICRQILLMPLPVCLSAVTGDRPITLLSSFWSVFDNLSLTKIFALGACPLSSPPSTLSRGPRNPLSASGGGRLSPWWRLWSA